MDSGPALRASRNDDRVLMRLPAEARENRDAGTASMTSQSRVAVDRPSRINDARNCIVAMQQ
jgi:hypothetical protein